MSGWQLERDRDGIQIYSRELAGSPFKAIRGVITVEARVASLLAIFQDLDACSNWLEFCVHASLVEKINDSEQYIYTLNRLPWPLRDRDVVSHVKWSRIPPTGSAASTIRLVAQAVPKRIPEKENVVRLTLADYQWIFTEQADGKVLIEMEAHVDPGGPIPGWLANTILVDAPFRTLDKFRSLMRSGRYRDARLPEIPEPAADKTPGEG